MRYTLKQFLQEYPDNDACLQAVFDNRYGGMEFCPNCGVAEPKYYRVRSRKSFECKDCRYQLSPLAGTIFHKSSTSLHDWFYAIYLFSVSKNGVSAKEIERSVQVSYKTAHRMAKQIRKLMADDEGKLGGGGTPVQVDETFVGGRRRQQIARDNKVAVIGALEKDGRVRTRVIDYATSTTALKFLHENVEYGSMVHTDESKIYTRVKRNWEHETVRHVSMQWVENGVHTNGIEGFWSILKTSLLGTYHAVSPRYLHTYVNEFGFRYAYRNEMIFPILVERAVKPF